MSTPEPQRPGTGAEDLPATQTAPAPPQQQRTQRWELKEIVLMVMLGVVFGFLYYALVQAWNAMSVIAGPLGDLSQHILFGGWLIVAPIAIAIIRRPFVGVIAELLAAAVQVVMLGTPAGPLLLVSALLQGGGSELAFALTRYRRYSWWVFGLSGALGAGIVFFYSAFRQGWYGQDIFYWRFGLQVLSGIIIGGLLAKVIVDALKRTGVVDGFAIVKDAARAHAAADTRGR